MYDKFYFIDFDGTITKQDSLDLLFETYADKSWKRYDQKWENGEIGSFENLSYAFSSFELTKDKLNIIVQKLKVDTSFYNFLIHLNNNNFGYMILSEGIDYIIKNTLIENAPKSFDLNLLNSLEVCSNHFNHNKVYFKNRSTHCKKINDCKLCSNCKYEITKRIKSKEKIYIGDGLSDRFGILNCNSIYAKNKLFNFCNIQKLKAKKFDSFYDIYN